MTPGGTTAFVSSDVDALVLSSCSCTTHLAKDRVARKMPWRVRAEAALSWSACNRNVRHMGGISRYILFFKENREAYFIIYLAKHTDYPRKVEKAHKRRGRCMMSLTEQESDSFQTDTNPLCVERCQEEMKESEKEKRCAGLHTGLPTFCHGWIVKGPGSIPLGWQGRVRLQWHWERPCEHTAEGSRYFAEYQPFPRPKY